MKPTYSMQVKLSAAPNFRDFGGLPTVDGRRIRYGMIYRSDALDALGDADLNKLGQLRIQAICDLRSAGEREHAPNRLPVGCSPELLITDETHGAGAADLAHAIRSGSRPEPAKARDYMVRTYNSFPLQFASTLRELFVRLSEGRCPVLIHCAAGKDRTGFVCAMLHHALGVPAKNIREDYLLSDRYFGVERIAKILNARTGLVAHPDLIDALRVRAEYLESVLARIEAEHDSIDGYLEQRAGLTRERRDLLRASLLEH